MRQVISLLALILISGCAVIQTHSIQNGMSKIDTDKKLSKTKTCWYPDLISMDYDSIEYCLYKYADERFLPFSKKKKHYIEGHYTRKREYFVEFKDGKILNHYWRSQYLYDLQLDYHFKESYYGRKWTIHFFNNLSFIHNRLNKNE